jgi:hypothetical protein
LLHPLKRWSLRQTRRGSEISTAVSNIAVGLIKVVEAVAKFVLPLDKAVTQSIGWKNAIEGIAATIALLNLRTAAFFALAAPRRSLFWDSAASLWRARLAV